MSFWLFFMLIVAAVAARERRREKESKEAIAAAVAKEGHTLQSIETFKNHYSVTYRAKGRRVYRRCRTGPRGVEWIDREP